MKINRVIPATHFRTMNDGAFSDMASQIITAINASGNFNSMNPQAKELQDALDTLNLAIANWKFGNKPSTLAKAKARENAEILFVEAANSCSSIANGDVELFLTSGFSVKRAPEKITSLSAPTLIKIVSNETGEVLIKFRGVKQARSYNLFMGTAKDNLTSVQVFTGTRAFITGLTPGQQYYFSLQAIGPRKIVSPKSPVIASYVV